MDPGLYISHKSFYKIHLLTNTLLNLSLEKQNRIVGSFNKMFKLSLH